MAVKYDDFDKECKDVCLEHTQEFQEGVTLQMQKPVVSPAGTPYPPHGPGPHRNYEAQIQEKFHLGKPQSTHALVSLMALFRQDHQDVLSCTYSTQGSHQGLLVRQFGPFDTMVNWMQQPFGGCGVFANVDWKTRSGVQGVTFIRNTQLSAQHLTSVWGGLSVGTKMRYDLNTKSSGLSGVFRYRQPSTHLTVCGEAEDTGAFKLSVVRRCAGMMDSTFCLSYEYGRGMHKNDKKGVTSFGVSREFLGHTKVRAVVNTDLAIKAVVDAPIGRVCNATYHVQWDAWKSNLKHGIQLVM
eukprot:TRINITY_DN10371_c0_g1_i1.p1 TRINITY_DN10371_c0_g1~~TRINITY_DN10371_c0_g1_i1.p1  ORF type:complete len:320 (+),score=96.45 TRINITY_DN10371_c0_g1_i1:72-962(+)